MSNGLDPDQNRCYIGLDLDPNHLILLIVFMKEFYKKVNLKKKKQKT